ncbi:MAG: hypothetical protein BGO11_17750 [Solirubrobacterales bacterium 70-9]|nr:MAG: hypothetical protein BGO11_17750 [Solirubrobacterales bacterium 70-9]
MLAAAAAVGGSLLVTAGATGATKGGEFGDTCAATQSGAPFGAVFERSHTGSPLPLAAPVSGVLTKWTAYMPALFPAEGVPPFTVRLVRVLGSGEVEVTAKAALESMKPGKNEFETRLPIEAGEYLAFGSNEGGAIVCPPPSEEEEERGIHAASGGIEMPLPQPGGKASFAASEVRVPVSGVIEPDVDGDGYGDLTQDGCPQGAEYHGACPVLHFAPGYTVGNGSVQVQVKSSLGARVAVTGVLPGLGTSLGTRKTIAAGKLTTFNLAIPPALGAQLRKLDSHKSLRVPLVARVNRVTGNVSTDRMTVRIPGRHRR